MIGTLVMWALGGLGVAAILWRSERQSQARAAEFQRRHEAEMARLQAEFDRMAAEDAAADAADDRPPPDPLAEIEAELDYIRGLVAEARRERASRTPAPALANPPATAMVMVPSERA